MIMADLNLPGCKAVRGTPKVVDQGAIRAGGRNQGFRANESEIRAPISCAGNRITVRFPRSESCEEGTSAEGPAHDWAIRARWVDMVRIIYADDHYNRIGDLVREAVLEKIDRWKKEHPLGGPSSKK
jgi:hypothetical protein